MQATLERLRERREQRGDEGGFTLIELLIVIVILGILAAIVVFAVQNLTGSSAKASCNSDYKSVETAAEAFKAQTGAYPGGTYFSGASVSAVADPSGYTSPGYSAGPPIVVGTNGVDYLLQKTDTVGTPATTIGPWLKDAPVNNGHYEIVLSNDGVGTITVYKSDGSAPITCATVG